MYHVSTDWEHHKKATSQQATTLTPMNQDQHKHSSIQAPIIREENQNRLTWSQHSTQAQQKQLDVDLSQDPPGPHLLLSTAAKQATDSLVTWKNPSSGL